VLISDLQTAAILLNPGREENAMDLVVSVHLLLLPGTIFPPISEPVPSVVNSSLVDLRLFCLSAPIRQRRLREVDLEGAYKLTD